MHTVGAHTPEIHLEQDQLLSRRLDTVASANHFMTSGMHPTLSTRACTLWTARWLLANGWDIRLCVLVAHHSGALYEAAERRLADTLVVEFPQERSPTAIATDCPHSTSTSRCFSPPPPILRNRAPPGGENPRRRLPHQGPLHLATRRAGPSVELAPTAAPSGSDPDLGRLGKRLGVDLRRRYVKVYEFQVRGVIHYHALIRLDGYHPDCPDAILPADRAVTREMFAQVVEQAFRDTSYVSRPHPANAGQGWRIAWGPQLDLRHVNAPGGEVNLAQITGYIAKYTTKSTEITGQSIRRVDDLSINTYGDPATHVGRLIRACWDLGNHEPYRRLRRWAHQYGYGGHITTKSRAFSVTLGFIRHQRTIWRRTDGYPQLWDDQEADLVVYRLGYHATGWITTGDALLANSAADAARRRANAARDALADEHPATLGYPKAA